MKKRIMKKFFQFFFSTAEIYLYLFLVLFQENIRKLLLAYSIPNVLSFLIFMMLTAEVIYLYYAVRKQQWYIGLPLATLLFFQTEILCQPVNISLHCIIILLISLRICGIVFLYKEHTKHRHFVYRFPLSSFCLDVALLFRSLIS